MVDEKSREVIDYIRNKEVEYNLMNVSDLQIETVIELYRQHEVVNDKTSESIGRFHVDIDCSDALTGLKAVQREARKATRALRELEERQKKVNISIDEKEIANAVMAELAKKESLKRSFK